VNEAVKDALRNLRDLSSASEGRLPTMRALAARWGVGVRTVQLAVSEAVAAGWLETRQGSGIWPRGRMPRPATPEARMDAVGLAERIAAEIRKGTYASYETLPVPKDYSQRHGIHPATARKAFGMLFAQGLVERKGRSWSVRGPQFKGASKAPVLLCIGVSDAEGRLRMDSDREWDFWREIQVEAIRCGLEPRLVAGDEVPAEQAFGAVVSTWHREDSTPLLDSLLRSRLPTAVWLANQEVLPGRRYRFARTMWFHDLASGREAGLTMAAHLAGLGHRKIAWISPFQAPWARNRLAGLREGLAGGVEVFEAHGPWINEWDIQAVVARDPAIRRRLAIDGLDDLGPTDALLRPLMEAVTRERCLERFGPRLREALDSGATLWVAASDLVAQWSLRWLEREGVRVPRDLAMVSFDDGREASRTDLTSLRFDVQGMAKAMVRQILSSREHHPLLAHYAGHVVVRSTTSPFSGGEDRGGA